MFSVIIPVHNKLPHLDRSIHSILNQTCQDFELILIDDASTDGSSEKLQEYNDPRIRRFRRDIPGPGGYAARNLGIKEAKYDWIAFLDADDEWNLSVLANLQESIELNKNAVDIISFDYMEINDKEKIEHKIRHHKEETFQLKDYLNETSFMLTGTIAINRTVINKGGMFPDNDVCKRGGDVDTWIRWLSVSRKNIHLDKTLFYYYRDTVNRVTATPNTHFCAYETLKDIYKTTEDKQLRKAIETFINRFIYNMLARQIRAGMRVDYNYVKKFHLNTYSILRIIKLYAIKYGLTQ